MSYLVGILLGNCFIFYHYHKINVSSYNEMSNGIFIMWTVNAIGTETEISKFLGSSFYNTSWGKTLHVTFATSNLRLCISLKFVQKTSYKYWNRVAQTKSLLFASSWPQHQCCVLSSCQIYHSWSRMYKQQKKWADNSSWNWLISELQRCVRNYSKIQYDNQKRLGLCFSEAQFLLDKKSSLNKPLSYLSRPHLQAMACKWI